MARTSSPSRGTVAVRGAMLARPLRGTRIRAMSRPGERSITRPTIRSTGREPGRVEPGRSSTRTDFASRTMWWLVRMRPSEPTTTPVPPTVPKLVLARTSTTAGIAVAITSGNVSACTLPSGAMPTPAGVS